MQKLPRDVYFVKRDDRYAGTVAGLRSPKSYVFAFRKYDDCLNICNYLLAPHKIKRKTDKSFVILKEEDEDTINSQSTEQVGLILEHEKTLSAITYAAMHNTRLFIVDNMIETSDKQLALLRTKVNPNSISVDPEIYINSLSILYEAS